MTSTPTSEALEAARETLRITIGLHADLIKLHEMLLEKVENPSRGYAVVIENAGDNYSAYVPDLPGCVASADTPEAVRKLIREAILFHIEGLRQDGLPVPKPTTQFTYVET